MNIKISNENLKIFILPAVGVVITIVLLVTVLVPQTVSILKLNSEIKKQEALSESLDRKVSILENINVEQYKTNFSKLAFSLPPSSDIPQAISQIQILTSKAKVTMLSFSVSVSSSSTSDNFQLRVDIEGGLDNINDFIVNLKSSPRLFVFNKAELIGSKSNSQYLASISLTAYFQPVTTKLSQIDQEIQPLTKEDLQEVADISKEVSQNQGVSENTTTGPKGKSNPFQ